MTTVTPTSTRTPGFFAPPHGLLLGGRNDMHKFDAQDHATMTDMLRATHPAYAEERTVRLARRTLSFTGRQVLEC
jgi:hypothetical protein